MQLKFKDPEKIVRYATLMTLTFMVCYGMAVVLVQVKPFWVDEWRVIYNLKYKDAGALWGPLDYMQQFPRVYLELIKTFTAPFHYSYFTLRFPSFVVGTCTILLSYRLMKRIYLREHFNKFLFVLILVSSFTLTEYFVQIKQYTMDILLSLVAIWQLLELLKLAALEAPVKKRYILLCISFLIVPFFSYTYPLAVLPVFGVILLHSISLLKNPGINKFKTLRVLWFPLLLCLISTAVFYKIDVSQVMVDRGMKDFWQKNMMPAHFSIAFMVRAFYELFAQVGAGDFFELVFAILGIASFIFGLVKCSTIILKHKPDRNESLRIYSVFLLLLTMALFALGKLPIESRLNAFTVPSIAMLIIYFISQLKLKLVRRKIAIGISALLYIGLISNVFISFITAIVSDEHTKKLAIYVNTENAIIFAQEHKLPILITPGVAYPYENTPNYPNLTSIPGDWVLKTYPAFKTGQKTKVFAINDMNHIKEDIKQLPPGTKAVLAGDGLSYHVIMLR